MTIETIKRILEEKERKTRGTYNKAVLNYALELAENIADNYTITQEQRDNLQDIDKETLKKLALSGADSWDAYSWGGSSLCYNYDILERLFCPSIVKKYEYSDKVRGVHLLDYQAGALTRAFAILYRTIKSNTK